MVNVSACRAGPQICWCPGWWPNVVMAHIKVAQLFLITHQGKLIRAAKIFSLNPKVHSALFAASVAAAALSLVLPGRPGLPAIGFFRLWSVEQLLIRRRSTSEAHCAVESLCCHYILWE